MGKDHDNFKKFKNDFAPVNAFLVLVDDVLVQLDVDYVVHDLLHDDLKSKDLS